MKTYVAVREEEGEATGGGARVMVEEGGKMKPLDPRFDLRNHSPTGFNWGFGGSGPAQLALAILADYLGDDDRAQDLYQLFKWEAIAGLDQEEGFTLTGDQIDAALVRIEAQL